MVFQPTMEWLRHYATAFNLAGQTDTSNILWLSLTGYDYISDVNEVKTNLNSGEEIETVVRDQTTT